MNVCTLSCITYRAMDGHPTIFMKVLHYTLFYSSVTVRNYLFSKDIDPNTVHMNDHKFMERTFFIIVSLSIVKSIHLLIHSFLEQPPWPQT